ncbi:MAG TPA: AAA family ATPase [Sideroxyarcus sp.]|nr:AAA family ATPase [Sideroxyarcus sp.]
MTDLAAQQQLIAALRDPGCYPHPAKTVRLVETHISWVLLAGRYAYKIKKAVDLGFLDFTTLEARRFYCTEEIRLNRRSAPHSYLDVVAIGGAPQQPQFGMQPAIEYAVKMRRFPAACFMDKMLRAGKIEGRHIDSLAATLASFHAGLPAVASDSGYGRGESIRAAAMQNFEPLPVDELTASLRQATVAAFAQCEPVFAERRAQGFVRECHGDLHLGNIVLLDDAPVPFDCIEFNPDLRWIDVMSEVAFTMMDMLYRQQPQFAWRFINAYLEKSGDYGGVAVLRFYLAYRATVRAKVATIRARQPGQSKRVLQNEANECSSYLMLAQHCLSSQRPALIITCGLPGSGKSTFAQTALERHGAIRIRSDVERKRLFGLQALENSRSGAGEGIYRAAATQQTYARLLQLAQQILAAGFTVIVDAAFLKRQEREQFQVLAQSMDVPFVIAAMQASGEVMQARILKRQAGRQDASEADLAVLKLLQAVQEPLAGQELAHSITFANNATTAPDSSAAWEQLAAVLKCGVVR